MADDLIDVLSDDISSGKSVGQDEKNNRPNAIREFGVEGAATSSRYFGGCHFFYTFMPEGLPSLLKCKQQMLEINDSKIIV